MMDFPIELISKYLLPASTVLVTLVVGRSLTLWVVQYITTPQNSKKIEEKRKKGLAITLNDIPGPVGYPFVGVLPLIIPYARRKRGDLFFNDTLEKYNGLFRMAMNAKQFIIGCDDAAIAKKVAMSDTFYRNTVFQEIAYDFAPNALFVLPTGDHWKKHRKGLQPAFGPVHLREAFKISMEIADQLLQIWETELMKGNNTRNVMEDFTMLTGDVISRVAFSHDLGAVKSLETHTANGFHDHANVITNAIEMRTAFPTLPFIWGLFASAHSQIAPSVEVVNSILMKAIESRQLRNQSSPEEKNQWSRDLMDRLMEPQGSVSFSDEEIMNELFGFFLAGHETTANALTYATLELAGHPEVVEKLRQEIDQVIGSETPIFENLPSLRYLDAVFKETLRCHTITPLEAKTAAEDVELTTSSGQTLQVAKGTLLMVPLSRIHRSKEYWGENAEEFYPDRWFIQNGDKLEDFVPVTGSFLPFWDGPHNCIGQKLAAVEAKMMIVRMVQRFDFKISPKQGPIEPVMTLTLGLKNGLLIEVSPRV